MDKARVYLAGPEVFSPDAKELGRLEKWTCSNFGLKGLYPLDNEITANGKHKTAQAIVAANIGLIDSCDYIIANLNNFRGSNIHPSCDSGTAWECGYGIQKGKIVIGHTSNINSIPEEIRQNIHLIVPNFFTAAELISRVLFRDIILPKYNHRRIVLSMNAPYPDIHDANAENAFKVGSLVARGYRPKVIISDPNLSQIQRYGQTDANGYSVEDFDYPMNIMIACTSRW